MKGKLPLLISLLIIALSASHTLYAHSSHSLPFRDANGKWGLKDSAGTVILKPSYAMMADFNGNGFIVARQTSFDNPQNARFGIISDKGEELLPVEYNEIGDFDLTGFAIVRKGVKYGIVNRNYEFVVPCRFAAVGKFNEQGFVWVNNGGTCDIENSGTVTGGSYGVYDAKGNEVVPPKYKAIGTFVRIKSDFAHPFASYPNIPAEFKEIEHEAESYNLYRSLYIENRLMSVMDMTLDNLIVVSKTGEYSNDGIIGPDGAELMPTDIADIIFYPAEGIVPLCRFEEGLLHANYFVINRQGLMFNNWPKVDCITPFNLGRAIMAVHGANRFIDTKGSKLGKAYTIILPSETGTFIVVADSRYGLIDNEGNEIIRTEYNVIHPVCENLMLAQRYKNGNVCYLTESGQVAITTNYNQATSFENGMAMVHGSGGWGMIDTSGRQLLNCKWFQIKTPSDTECPLYWVKTEKGGRFYCVDANQGDAAFFNSFIDVSNFSEYYADIAFVYGNDRKVGCIDRKGNTIIPCVLDDIQTAVDVYLSMLKDGKDKWSDFDLRLWQKRKTASSTSYSIQSTISNNLWDY